MEVISLSKHEVDERLRHPFNAPILGATLSKDQFGDEWFKVRRDLMAVLDRLGTHDHYGEGDYYLGEEIVMSRGIGFQVTSDKMLTKDLLPAIQGFLKELPTDYEVCVSPSFPDDDGKIWHLFISKDHVRADCSDSVLRRLI